MAYRLLCPTKWERGARRSYVNLAVFNRTCPTRGSSVRECVLTSLRCLRGAEGLATVRTTPLVYYVDPISGRPLLEQKREQVWRLHFASCTVLKQHLRKRVSDPRGLL